MQDLSGCCRARLLLSVVVLTMARGMNSQVLPQEVCNSTSSATFRVENKTGAQQLNAAVNCINGGQLDAIWVGTITLDNPISIGLGTFLSITGKDRAAEVRGKSGTRMFDIFSGGGLNLSQLTLSRGTAANGGAIKSTMAALVLENCIFEDNIATDGSGGAVWVEGGELTITGGEFLNNTASLVGGAVLTMNADLVVQGGTRFENNKAVEGGALYCGGIEIAAGSVNASCSLGSVEFFSNNASADNSIFDINYFEEAWDNLNGGGAAAFSHAKVNITNCTFKGNFAQLSGGALFEGNGTSVTIKGCNFWNNTTPGYGGAIAGSSIVIEGYTELSYNSAAENGGGVRASVILY